MRISHLTKILYGLLGLLVASMALAGLWLKSAVEIPEEGVAVENRNPVPEAPAADTWPGREVWAGPEEAQGLAGISRFELAGTFQVFDGEPETVEAAALVDDRETGVQRIVREGEDLGMFRVSRIFEDRLTLLRGERSWELTLTGVKAIPRPGTPEAQTPSAPMDPFDLPALESNRFGKRVKENYWILEREALKGYIDEMMEPQNMVRTVNLYRSFSQRTDQGDEEPGFEIGMKAEQDFFQDMGLQDGDIIRKVNSMEMKTQQRAEYLLREFYRDNMSAVVLDVERNGENQQHIYLVR